MDAYENLANAIIIQAVRDYRHSLKKIKKDPGDKKASIAKRDIEKFFKSKWFKCLSRADGVYIMEKVRGEIER